MEIVTEFEIGQKVWHVWNRIEREVGPCSICGGAGKVPVVGVGELIGCPKCYGKGETADGEQFVRTMVRDAPMTVGKVEVSIEGPTYGRDGFESWDEDQHNMGPRSQKREERYMMVETGVGSGTLYYARDLFATLEEAEAEARRRTESSQAGIGRYHEVDQDG